MLLIFIGSIMSRPLLTVSSLRYLAGIVSYNLAAIFVLDYTTVGGGGGVCLTSRGMLAWGLPSSDRSIE